MHKRHNLKIRSRTSLLFPLSLHLIIVSIFYETVWNFGMILKCWEPISIIIQGWVMMTLTYQYLKIWSAGKLASISDGRSISLRSQRYRVTFWNSGLGEPHWTNFLRINICVRISFALSRDTPFQTRFWSPICARFSPPRKTSYNICPVWNPRRTRRRFIELFCTDFFHVQINTFTRGHPALFGLVSRWCTCACTFQD